MQHPSTAIIALVFLTSIAPHCWADELIPRAEPLHLAQYADHACKACRNNCVNARERENVGCCTAQGGRPQPASCSAPRDVNAYAQCLRQVSDREKACWQRCEPCGNTSNPNARIKSPTESSLFAARVLGDQGDMCK